MKPLIKLLDERNNNKGLRNKEKLVDAVEKLWKLDIDRDIKKKLMDELIWKIGETPNGKYNLKYRSEGAIGITDLKLLHHEHVISRKKIREALVDAKSIEEVREILKMIETCVVTREEHKRLNKSKTEGWAKYKEIGIKVFDILENKQK